MNYLYIMMLVLPFGYGVFLTIQLFLRKPITKYHYRPDE